MRNLCLRILRIIFSKSRNACKLKLLCQENPHKRSIGSRISQLELKSKHHVESNKVKLALYDVCNKKLLIRINKTSPLPKKVITSKYRQKEKENLLSFQKKIHPVKKLFLAKNRDFVLVPRNYPTVNRQRRSGNNKVSFVNKRITFPKGNQTESNRELEQVREARRRKKE